MIVCLPSRKGGKGPIVRFVRDFPKIVVPLVVFEAIPPEVPENLGISIPFDLTGNAAEWVVRTEDNDTNYDHVVKGCYWARCYRPPHTPSCDYVNWMHQGAERSYEMGFRCCKDRE